MSCLHSPRQASLLRNCTALRGSLRPTERSWEITVTSSCMSLTLTHRLSSEGTISREEIREKVHVKSSSSYRPIELRCRPTTYWERSYRNDLDACSLKAGLDFLVRVKPF